MARAPGLESLQLNCKTRIDLNTESLACCKDCVPAIFCVAAPFRSFDECDLSVAKANEVVNGLINTIGVIDGNAGTPCRRAVGADHHGRDTRRFAGHGINQQQALGSAFAEGFNMPLNKFLRPE